MLLKKGTHNLKLKSINRKLKKSLITELTSINYRYKEYSLYIPEYWNVAVVANVDLNSSVLYITNPNYYLNFSFKNLQGFVHLDSYTNTVLFKSVYTNSYYSPFIRTFESTLLNFIKPTFMKLKFKGKGYYIYKNTRNTVAPQFGYSHRLYIYSYFTAVKFLGKTKVIVFGLNKLDILHSSSLIKAKRSINIFTGRGVRFSKQVVYKKQGKVSSYR